MFDSPYARSLLICAVMFSVLGVAIVISYIP